MNINQNLRNECIISLDKFDEENQIGTKKPSVNLTKKITRELKRFHNQKSKFSKIFPLLKFHIEKNNPVYKKKVKSALEINCMHQIVLVVYQPDGLSEYWIKAIEQISKTQECLCIVANAGLIKKDILFLHRLKNVTYIIRNNFGLDFGAYRDAVITILSNKNTTEKLTLMNDSFFFPLFNNVQDLFKNIDSIEGDFIGLVENTNRDKIDDFHYGSFFLQIRHSVLTDPDFFSFWLNFEVSNSKKKNIQHGEKGLSQFIREKDFSHKPLFNYEDLLIKLKGLDCHKLLEAVDDVVLCYLPEWREKQNNYRIYLKEEFEVSELWKKHAIEWIDHVVEPFNKTHAGAILYPKMLGMPILKRDLKTYYGSQVWIKISNKLNKISTIKLN